MQKQSALQLLKKAADVFDRCYGLQLARLNEQDLGPEHGESASQSSGSEYNSANAVAEEHWASLLEPLTHDTLIDTTIAQIDVYTSICSLHPCLSAADLDDVNAHATRTFDNQDSLSAHTVSRHSELPLARANFKAALLDANFRLNRLDAHTYEIELKNAFAAILQPTLESSQAHCDYADALLTFHATIVSTADENERSRLSQLQWTLLSSALFSYQRALALPNVRNVTQIHMRRGDCELLRYRMGERPLMYKPASASATTLLKNAAVFYRGSAATAKAEGIEGGSVEPEVKEAVANALVSGVRLDGLSPSLTEIVGSVLEEMGNEGLISEDAYWSLIS